MNNLFSRYGARMAQKGELLWHYTYKIAGREAEKADDRPPGFLERFSRPRAGCCLLSRPKGQAFADLIHWNRHCLELGLLQAVLDELFGRFFGVVVDSQGSNCDQNCSCVHGENMGE